MKDKIFLNAVFIYMVDFGCHGNVKFERIICIFCLFYAWLGVSLS